MEDMASVTALVEQWRPLDVRLGGLWLRRATPPALPPWMAELARAHAGSDCTDPPRALPAVGSDCIERWDRLVLLRWLGGALGSPAPMDPHKVRRMIGDAGSPAWPLHLLCRATPSSLPALVEQLHPDPVSIACIADSSASAALQAALVCIFDRVSEPRLLISYLCHAYPPARNAECELSSTAWLAAVKWLSGQARAARIPTVHSSTTRFYSYTCILAYAMPHAHATVATPLLLVLLRHAYSSAPAPAGGTRTC